MTTDVCAECNGDIVWDSDAGSAVCIGCGILQDPAQVVLDSHLDTVDKPYDNYGHIFPTGPSSVGFRNQTRWHLAGESKQAAAESNKITMRHYIADLARRIGYSALASRTTFLSERAMEEGRFRYGRKARLVAGSCLAIALREAQKGETIKDIAYLVDESPVALAHVFTTVVTLLKIRLTSLDPSWHFPALQKHVLHILAEPDPPLPTHLTSVIKSIHIPSALRTAYSLAELVSRSGLLTNLPSPPTACAIYILALEGELSSSLPHCGEFAEAVGMRFGVRKGVIMRRYKSIYDRVEGWASEVPWVSHSPESVAGKTSSSKVAKRVAVARCLKDAVQFQEVLWKSKLASSGHVRPTADDTETVSSSDIDQSKEVNLDGKVEASTSSGQSRKRRKNRHIVDASQFLVSPDHSRNVDGGARIGVIPSLDVVSHMLTADSSSFQHAPTRLQLLLSEQSAEEITDDQLFTDGELEGYMRSEDEQQALKRVFDWAREEGVYVETDSDDGYAISTRSRDPALGSTSRINLEALNRLLNEKEETGRVEAIYTDDNDWALAGIADDLGLNDDDHVNNSELGAISGNSDPNTRRLSTDDDAVIITPWRPISPGGRAAWADTICFEDPYTSFPA